MSTVSNLIAAVEALVSSDNRNYPQLRKAVVDAATFATPDPLTGELRLLAAARLGKARLIDNLGVTVDHGAHR